jgi:outer membrane lipase/esterase
VAAWLVFTALSAPGAAGAADFNQFVVFGDSTLDTGYFRYTTTGDPTLYPPQNLTFDQLLAQAITKGATGGWAGNGVMNTTILAGKFNLTAAPSDIPGGGGTNYANGGATTVVNPESMVPDNVCTIQQIQNYLSSVHGVANPNAIYLIKTGDNDVTFVNSQSQAWLGANPDYLSNGAVGLAETVASLQAAGARTIVVRNSYDSALFAARGGDIDPVNTVDYQRSRALGTWEWAYMAERGVNFIPADNDSLFSYVAHHPRLFGFTEDTVLAANAPFANPHISACFDILTPEQQKDYLFIDGVHLTTAGQTIEADYTYNLLTAPSQMSLLAETIVQGGWARAATIQGQLDPSAQHRGPNGINVWASAGAYSLAVDNATGLPNDSSTPIGGTVGIDYQLADGVIMGMAFSSANQSPRFSTGGHFDEADEAPSLYVAYVGGPLWGSAIVTYNAFRDNTVRLVPLGILTDEDFGHTTGQSLAFALHGGYDLSLGGVTTGPVAGLMVQQVNVNGFTETGDTGVTALSFGSQVRESLVTQLGWRVALQQGPLRPFVEAAWNHECAGKNRTITTSLTTVGAPSYTMDAVPIASDWCTTSLGAFYELSPQVMLRGAASAMFINPQMTTYGGEVGLNVAF